MMFSISVSDSGIVCWAYELKQAHQIFMKVNLISIQSYMKIYNLWK